MTRVVIGVIVLALGGAVSLAAQDAKPAGDKVYAEQKCMVCHSIAGQGNAKGSLDEVGSKLTADEIRAWLVDAKAMTTKTKATRKPEMKAYVLAKEDVDALVTYLSAMKKK